MTTDPDLPVTFDDVRSAAERIEGVAHRTPVMTSRTIDARASASVFFKCENLQRMGAFKFRGAYNAMSRLNDEQKRRGVLAFSSGNHAQAVALSGRLLGVSTTIVMPRNAPRVKLDATRGYGGEVVEFDPSETAREELGRRLAEERGLTVIPPFDHPHVIAGQGTAAMELFEDAGDLDYLLVCCGGGGLLSGSLIAAQAMCPSCKVVGVEPAAGDDGCRSFRSGKLERIDHPDTIADGARTPSLGELTFSVIKSLAHDMVSVPDDDTVRAMFLLWERMKIVVEPTGALAIAALLSGAVRAPERRVGVTISGGNVDLRQAADLFAQLPR